MKRVAFFMIAVIALAVGVSAQAVAVGGKLDDFSMADSTGKTRLFADLKGTSGTVPVLVVAGNLLE